MKTGFVSLEITMLLDDDIGEYTCIAKNATGQAVCQALIMKDGKNFCFLLDALASKFQVMNHY